MKVILLQDIDTLGDKDDVKQVATGYAKNFLIPRGLAIVADKVNLTDLERRKFFAARKESKIDKQLEKSADNIRNTEIEILAKAGPEGKLYGSVSAKDIAALLSEKFGLVLDKKRVRLAEPIRKTGETRINVRIKENLVVDVLVTVKSDAPPEPESHEPAEELKAEPEPAAETAAQAPSDDSVESESDSDNQ